MGRFRVCYKCEERHVSCHDHCEKYLAEQKENETARKKQQEQQYINSTVASGSFRRGQLKKAYYMGERK